MQLCAAENHDAVIAIGNVIRGETPHFDYVCSAVAQGIKDCNVMTNVPAIFCVLTDDNKGTIFSKKWWKPRKQRRRSWRLLLLEWLNSEEI